MILRVFAIATASVVALLAIVGYSPLVDGMEDRYRAMLFQGVYKLLRVTPFLITERLGLGSFIEYIPSLQRSAAGDLSAPPRSASYGDLRVTRAMLAGRHVIIYKPRDLAKGELLPGLLYFHGGGWALQSPDFCDRFVYDFANCTRTITISVDYRLAPKYPFPVPVHDSLDVTRHVLKHGNSLGVDVNRVGVAGDDAGGNLAAAVALRLSSEKSSGLPPLKFHAVLYAPLQALNFRLPSYIEINESIPMLGSNRMASYWALYMGLELSGLDKYTRLMQQNRHVTAQLLYSSKYSEYISSLNLPHKFRNPRPHLMAKSTFSTQVAKSTAKDAKLAPKELALFNRIKHHVTNPLLSPLMAPDLGGLPPALVLVAEFDVLRDDGLLYAHRLREAGVKTEVFIGKGYHNDFFRIFPEYFHSDTGTKALQAVCAFLKREA